MSSTRETKRSVRATEETIVEPVVVNVKVAYLRPKYQNLKEFCEGDDNVYVGRKGIVFINKERYTKKDSIWAIHLR